jgi:hypothetical protein
MSGKVCRLFPGFDARAPRLYDRSSLESSQYALSARRQAARVRSSYAQSSAHNSPSTQHRLRNDSCRRGAHLDLLCDWEFHAN